MRCPTLSMLPDPPQGKSGWPWTEETPPLLATMPDGSPWPRVSIVTPSYNQGEFIEETIRSVLLQSYPNLEYIIMDGGSDDDSINIIQKYESSLAHWISEPDEGQSDALNKGFEQTTGSILTWLNSDDRLQPGAVQVSAEFFMQQPEIGVVYGDFNKIDRDGNIRASYKAPEFDLHRHVIRDLIPQPAAFFRREVWEQIGPLSTKFHYVMDYDLWTRAALCFPIKHVPMVMADVRFHDASKSVGQSIHFMHEHERLFDDFFALPNLPPKIRALEPLARGTNYFVMGRQYLKAQQHREARNAFEHAWRIYPLSPQKLIILPFWIDSMWQTNLGMPLFRLLTWLKNGEAAVD